MDNLWFKFKHLPLRTRKIIVSISSFILFVAALAVADYYDAVDLNIIERGFEAQQVIEEDGGVIEINNFNSDINHLSLTVPKDSFLDPVEFTISIEPTDNYELNDKINPISPLILVENNNQFAYKTMTLSIPIEIDTTTETAMAFFYYKDTGILEAIPTASISDTEIQITTMHFSNIVVSSITYEELDKLVENDKEMDSGFLPGEDDWQFVNFGSSITPEGNCAGQTITSAYYYVTRTKQGEDNLWGIYNNDTPDFWLDDTLAYRYVSVVQDEMDFTSDQYVNYLNYSKESDRQSYYSFLYAIYVTGNPQFVAIYSHESDIIVSGHALLVYKVTKDRLYMSDPNFPGDTERYIKYSEVTGFDIYGSGDNVRDIDDNGVILYDTFAFVGLSALVNFEFIEIQYERMQVEKVGQYHFPNLSLDYMEEYYISHDDINWIPIEDNFLIPIDYNLDPHEEQLGRVIISGTTKTTNVVYTVFKDHRPFITNIKPDESGYFFAVLPLVNGINNYGVLAETIENGRLHYTDYHAFTYSYYGPTYVPEDKSEAIIGTYYFEEEDSAVEPLENHQIIIRENGELVESYLSEEGRLEYNGTWSLNEVDDGYEIVLSSDLGTKTYIVKNDFQQIYIQDQEYYKK